MGYIGIIGNPGADTFEAARVGVTPFGTPRGLASSCWSATQSPRNLDAVVVCGNRAACGSAAALYADLGIPVLMFDLVHLGRGGVRYDGGVVRQYRVTPVDHAWLPERASSGRLEALEAAGQVTIQEPTKRVKGQKIMICGQREGDPTHGMSREAFRAWAEAAVGKCKSLDKSEVVWRPHPLDAYQIAGADAYSDPREESLEDAMAGCWLVVVYSSTCGLDALLAGKPVLADGPAVYSELAGSFNDWKGLCPPDPAKLRTLLERIASTQWTVDEIATGEPFGPFLEPPPEPEEVPEPDDFASIKGIGPKAALVLFEAGFLTFADLCDAPQDHIDSIGLSKPALEALEAYRGETSEAADGE